MRLPIPMSFGSLHMNVLPDVLSTRPKNLNLMRVFTMRIVRTAVEPPVFSLHEDKTMPDLGHLAEATASCFCSWMVRIFWI